MSAPKSLASDPDQLKSAREDIKELLSTKFCHPILVTFKFSFIFLRSLCSSTLSRALGPNRILEVQHLPSFSFVDSIRTCIFLLFYGIESTLHTSIMLSLKKSIIVDTLFIQVK